jgi:GT2 family glycosyltransferase
MPKISIIIVSWNVASSLKRCLDSILATKYQPLEIIVIDNASTDNSLSVIKNFRSIRLIKNFHNVGLPKGVNIGLNQATGDFILQLNPDCSLPVDFFRKSLKFFDQFPNAALMGPKLVDPDGTPQGSVFPEPSIGDTFKEFWQGRKGLTSKYTPSGDLPVLVNAVSGACMFFPRHTLNLVGKFTEKVFMYYEDLDFCRRIRQSGRNIYFNPEIQVIHEHGASSKKSPQAQKYLWNSSLWYNGPFRHYLMWFITRSSQLFNRYN